MSHFEMLERRALLAGNNPYAFDPYTSFADLERPAPPPVAAPGTAAFGGGALVVAGTDGADVIRFDYEGDRAFVTVNGRRRGFDGVRSISVDAGPGDDVVNAYAVATRVGNQITLAGGAGADTLVGGDAGELILGGAGDDQIYAYAGENAVDGGEGNDVIHAEEGGAQFGFFTGSQALLGGPGDDLIYGGSVGGGASIGGGEGNDTLLGGSLEDSLIGGGGRDLLLGNGGRDRLDGGVGSDKLYGGEGADSLLGGGGSDLLFGGNGQDWLNGAGGADRLWGDDYDTPSGDREKAPFNPEVLKKLKQRAADISNGTYTGSVITGLSGTNDSAYLPPGTPLVEAPNFDQLDLAAFAELDAAFGPSLTLPDGETLAGDTMRGGSGDDVLVGGPGADEVRGGSGRDTVDYSGRIADLRVTLDGVADDGRIAERRTTVVGGEYNDFGEFFTDQNLTYYGDIPGAVVLPLADHPPLAAEADNVLPDVEDVWSGTGDDVLVGTDGPNLLMGAAGNDAISGGGGPDVLTGGDGADSLAGGEGPDTLVGGRGPDVLWGGPGVDTADYSRAGGRTSVTFDNKPDDGERGEGDNVASDVELLR